MFQRCSKEKGPSPEQLAVEREQIDRLQHLLLSVRDDYREILLMRFHGEMSLAEIAEATSQPVGTIKSAISRRAQQLRTSYDRETVSQARPLHPAPI